MLEAYTFDGAGIVVPPSACGFDFACAMATAALYSVGGKWGNLIGRGRNGVRIGGFGRTVPTPMSNLATSEAVLLLH